VIVPWLFLWREPGVMSSPNLFCKEKKDTGIIGKEISLANLASLMNASFNKCVVTKTFGKGSSQFKIRDN
jgi:hypothetical protein